MIKSMTGFGKSITESQDYSFNVEIRTLNSKQLDINLRLPVYLKEFELEIRNIVSKKLQRGKIDINIIPESKTVISAPVIDHDLAKHYYSELDKLNESLRLQSKEEYLSLILKLPDVLNTPEESISREVWDLLQDGINTAIEQVDEFRISEGNTLMIDFVNRINTITELLIEIAKYEDNRIERINSRIRTNLENNSDDIQLDKNRLEQEMIYYLEKLDITEEKIRLKKHCEYFLETMKMTESSGKKLSFISQEIGREINTIGSKANDADIQKLVVLMKDELEKVKEQLFNIL
jgi:uncharacterized protein (TIGR00255 family)